MNKRKWIWAGVAVVLLVPAALDGFRYLKPDSKEKQLLQAPASFPPSAARKIILVYNAWGGIYPGIVDFVHKEAFPASYPCNLCYQTFETFEMKKEWRHFLDSLPFQKTELHKDEFKRRYEPGNMPLPLILLSNGKGVQPLLTAEEINKYHSLESLTAAVRSKLR